MARTDNMRRERPDYEQTEDPGEAAYTDADSGDMYLTDKGAFYLGAGATAGIGVLSGLGSFIENMTDTLPGTRPRREKIAIKDDALRHVRRAQDLENPEDIYVELRKAEADLRYGNAFHTRETANMTAEDVDRVIQELENDPSVEELEYPVDNTKYDYLFQIADGHLGRFEQPDQTYSVSHLENILDKNAHGETMQELREIDSELKEYDRDIDEYREEVERLEEEREQALDNGNEEKYKELSEDLVIAEGKMLRAQQARAETLDSRGKLLQYQEELLSRLEETTEQVGSSRTGGLNVMEPHNFWAHRIMWASFLGGEIAGGGLAAGANRALSDSDNSRRR